MFRPKTIVAVAEHTEMTPERWQQITGVFHAALLRNPGQRGTFLQDACGADEALRAEIEAMLAAHDNAGDPAAFRRSQCRNRCCASNRDPRSVVTGSTR